MLQVRAGAGVAVGRAVGVGVATLGVGVGFAATGVPLGEAGGFESSLQLVRRASNTIDASMEVPRRFIFILSSLIGRISRPRQAVAGRCVIVASLPSFPSGVTR